MTQEHFENEFLIVDLAGEPGCVLKMEVKATPKTVAEAHRNALSAVRKEVSLPGFRRGKVPESLLNTHFAKAIEQEWKDQTLNLSFQKTLDLTGKKPVRASAEKIKSTLKAFQGLNGPAEIYFEFEGFPTVPAFEMNALSLSIPASQEVSDTDVDETIEAARQSLSTWEEVEGKAAEKGDFIRLDMVETEGGETQIFQNRRLIIADKKMAPWLMEIVVGMQVGESREGVSIPDQSLDDNTIDKELKALFKPIRYRITLQKIEQPLLPELDDAFAQKLGAKDVAEMKATIRKQLQAQRDHERRVKLIEDLEEALFERHNFDLPRSLVHKDTLSFEQSKTQALRSQGNLSEAEVAEHKELIRTLAEKESRKRLALYYLMNEFNAKNNVHVSRNDLNAKLSQLLKHIPEDMVPQVLKSLNDDFYAAILSETVIEKGLDYIAEKLLAA